MEGGGVTGFWVLTAVVWIACPALVWLAGWAFDREHDQGAASGCCVLWLVLAVAWAAQAAFDVVGGGGR